MLSFKSTIIESFPELMKHEVVRSEFSSNLITRISAADYTRK